MIKSVKNQSNILLKRAYIFLEVKLWGNAEKYFDRTLDFEPENARAYMGLLLVNMKASNIEELLNVRKYSARSGKEILFYEEDYFKKALKYADDEYIKEIENLKEESIYRRAVADMENSNYDASIQGFDKILEYKDACTLKYECIYKQAMMFSSRATIKNLKKTIGNLEQILNYKDASEMKEKILDEISLIKRNRIKALIIVAIILATFSVLFSWWA